MELLPYFISSHVFIYNLVFGPQVCVFKLTVFIYGRVVKRFEYFNFIQFI